MSDKKFVICTFFQELIKAMQYTLNPLRYLIKRRIQYLLQTEMTRKAWQYLVVNEFHASKEIGCSISSANFDLTQS
jgi:hypothetical protein